MPAINIKTCLFLIIFSLGFLIPSYSDAFFWNNDNVLVEINGQKFTDDHYKHWWKEWQEPQMTLPETPDEFINWMLLVQESDTMQLFENPSYLNKVNVFLKVQSLMLLRKEEISDRMTVPTEVDLKNAYQGEYSPLLNLRMLALQTPEEVQAVQSLIGFGTPLKQIAEQTGYSDPVRYIEESGEMRPLKVPEPIRDVALALMPGEIGGPVIWQGTSYFVEMITRREGTDDDFKSLRERLVSKHSKNEDDRLTRLLIDNLTVKYNVEVDRDFLNGLTQEGVPEEETGRIVIKIGETEVTAERLYRSIQKQLRITASKKVDVEKFQQARDAVVTGIVNQTLLGIESIDRHYEQRPPFLHTFEFYKQHRLIRELESDYIRAQVNIDKSDIQKEYQDHPERYAKEGKVIEFIKVDTRSEKLARVLGDQLKAGEDFESIMKVLEPTGYEIEKKSADQLKPEIRDALSALVPGQAVGPIASEGKLHFVKLIDHADYVLAPLEMVTPEIQAYLSEEKFNAAREDYIQRLKEHSRIKINNKTWTETRRQILEAADDQN